MARRGREAALKRAREKSRQEKREAKHERREAKKGESAEADPADSQELMEEFARLSQRFEDGRIDAETYHTQKHRIFVDLGIESDDT